MERKRTFPFSTALEQAEQLWTAAQNVGVAARAILLYYGLVQAGLALAISRVQGSWAWSGHGLRLDGDKDLSTVKQLREVTLRDDGSGGFQAIAGILHSPTLPNSVVVEQVWMAIPEAADLRPTACTAPNVLEVAFSEADMPVGYKNVETVTIVLSPAPEGVRQGAIPQRDAVVWLSSYPTLAESEPIEPQYWPIGAKDGVRFRLRIAPTNEYRVADAARKSFAKPYGWTDFKWIAAPALAGNREVVHPLLVWWALLYAFSMLARYYPAAWAKMTNIDASNEAVLIERMLDIALFRVPDLLVRESVDPA